MSRRDLRGRHELARLLNYIKKLNVRRFEPSFEPILGVTYKELEQQYSLEEQIRILESLKKISIVNSEPSILILKCAFCNFHNFSTCFTCTLCRSANVVRGTAIQHDSCGNIDFEHKYAAFDGTLVCEKCNKRLKAIGVDYSKVAYFYQCLSCNAKLPNMELRYSCLRCGKSSTQDELPALQLFAYTVSMPTLSELSDDAYYMQYVMEQLDRAGIKASLFGTLTGLSKIQHTFTIVVYDGKDVPVLVVETIYPVDNGDDRNSETVLLSFIARCLDIKIPNKILVAIPTLLTDLRALASTYGITVIEANTKYQTESRIVQTIIQIYNDSFEKVNQKNDSG
jgi:hypothetical protein